MKNWRHLEKLIDLFPPKLTGNMSIRLREKQIFLTDDTKFSFVKPFPDHKNCEQKVINDI